jgi:hypothetical protein
MDQAAGPATPTPPERTPCPSCGRPRAGAFRYCLGCGHDFEVPVSSVAEPVEEPVVEPAPAPAEPALAAAEPAPAPAEPAPAPAEPAPAPAEPAPAPAEPALAAAGPASEGPSPPPAVAAVGPVADRRRLAVLTIAVGVLAIAVAALALAMGPLGSASASPTPGIPIVGTGVAVADVTTVHALERFGGFTFETGELSDGRPRTSGRDLAGESRISLIGPVDDLHELSLEVPAHRVDRLVQFAALWFPEAAEFVGAAGARASGETERQRFGTTEVSVRVRTDGEGSVTISRLP